MSRKNQEKIKLFSGEKIQLLPFRRTLKGHRYAVTNHGRVIRFQTTPEEGELIRQYKISAGYPCVFIQANGKRTNAMVHRLVAQAFLPPPQKAQVFVLHKDRDRTNNHATNLKWASKEEHLAHAMGGNDWKAAYRATGRYKLTEDRVRLIRKKIQEGKTRMKMIARQFGITDMQLYRIRSGENWGWVK